jgi:hypothetical protein
VDESPTQGSGIEARCRPACMAATGVSADMISARFDVGS